VIWFNKSCFSSHRLTLIPTTDDVFKMVYKYKFVVDDFNVIRRNDCCFQMSVDCRGLHWNLKWHNWVFVDNIICLNLCNNMSGAESECSNEKTIPFVVSCANVDRYEFLTTVFRKTMYLWHKIPPQINYVATLPCKIWNSKCTFYAVNYVIISSSSGHQLHCSKYAWR